MSEHTDGGCDPTAGIDASEAQTFWAEFLSSLARRGLARLRLVILIAECAFLVCPTIETVPFTGKRKSSDLDMEHRLMMSVGEDRRNAPGVLARFSCRPPVVSALPLAMSRKTSGSADGSAGLRSGSACPQR